MQAYSKGGFRGVLGVPPSRFIAPLSKVLLGTGKSPSSVSLGNLRVTATLEEGCMEGQVVKTFFFCFSLGKIGKICEVVSSHTYVSATKGVSSAATV